MSILIKVRKKLLDNNKTITWLSKKLNVSRQTFYRKIDSNDIDFIIKVNNILKTLDK